MQIRTNTWHYWLWSSTFEFGDERRPKETTRRQYVFRILQMLIPFTVVALLDIIFWVLAVTLGNLIAILSGSGYYWSIWWEEGPRFRRFSPWQFSTTVYAGILNFDTSLYVTTKTIAKVIWLCIAIYTSWYVWANTTLIQQLGDVTIKTAIIAVVGMWPIFLLVGKIILLFVIIFFVAFVMMKLSDRFESASQEHVQQLIDDAEKTSTPLPPEIVTFIDPAVDDAAVGI
ncbi:MAG: hypothetical protein WC791_00920 [Candidatus Paceibacterota bacterium]|jgi:hypothetical protein